MPIYEYMCNNCGYELEKLQKISDAALTVCPKCNQAQLVKKISAAGFRLKGSGWYETDFKSSKDKQRNLASDTTSETNNGDSSTESKSNSNANSNADSNSNKTTNSDMKSSSSTKVADSSTN